MKIWKCPSCKRRRYYSEDEKLVMKICYVCQVGMEVVDEPRKKS